MAEIIKSLYHKKGDTVFYSRIIQDNPSCYLVRGQIFYDGYGIISQTIDRKDRLNIDAQDRENLHNIMNTLVPEESFNNEYSRDQTILILKVQSKSEKTNLVTPIGLFFFRSWLEMSVAGRLHNLKLGELSDSHIRLDGVTILFAVNDWKKSISEIKKILDKKGLCSRSMIFRKIALQADESIYDCVYPSYFEGSYVDWL